MRIQITQLIILLLSLMVNSMNQTEVKENSVGDDCLTCLDSGGIFYKHVYMARSLPRFICRHSPLESNYSWIVDRVCEKNDCQKIETRPVRIILKPEEMQCSWPLEINLDSFPPVYATNTSINFQVANCNQTTPILVNDADYGIHTILNALIVITITLEGLMLLGGLVWMLSKKQPKRNSREMKPLNGCRA